MSISSAVVDLDVAVDPLSPSKFDPDFDIDVAAAEQEDALKDDLITQVPADDVSLKLRDLPPPPEDVYESVETAREALQAWGKDNGVAYNVEKWSGEGRCRLLMRCSKAGRLSVSKKATGKRPGAASRLTNCPMRIWVVAVDRTEPGGQWRVQHCENNKSIAHNHPPAKHAASIARHRRDSRRGVDFRNKIAELLPLSRGAKRAKLMAKSTFDGIIVSRQDVRNEFRAYRRQELQAKTVMERVVELLDEKKYWYKYAAATDEHLTTLFFIHPGCLQLYKQCPEVLMVDCTYKTNKYNLPLLNLVSSCANNRTIHLGVALMRDVDEGAFTWIFEHLKQLFEQHHIPTPLFISDRDNACINALESVFKYPRIHLCRWHINKDVLAYIRRACGPEFCQVKGPDGRLDDSQNTKQLMNLYYATLESCNLPDCEANLKLIEATCWKFANYLEREWLGRHAKKLVSIWVDAEHHYGCSSTSKTEGGNRALKDWIGGSQSDVLGLFTALNCFYDEHVEHLTSLDEYQNNSLRGDCANPIFAAAYLQVSRFALAETAKQLALAHAELSQQRLDLCRKTPSCKSQYTTIWGLPCYHKLLDLMEEGTVLRRTDFDIHWWTDRSQAETPAPHRLVPLEPRRIVTRRPRTTQRTSQKKGAGARGNRRGPTLAERLDESIPSATAPAAMPYRMRSASPDPVKNCVVVAPSQPTITGPSFPPPSAPAAQVLTQRLQYPTPSPSPFNPNLQAYQQAYPQQQYASQVAYQQHQASYQRHQFQYPEQPHVQQHQQLILPPLTQPMLARPVDNSSPNLVSNCPSTGVYREEPRARIPSRQSAWVAYTTFWQGQ